MLKPSKISSHSLYTKQYVTKEFVLNINEKKYSLIINIYNISSILIIKNFINEILWYFSYLTCKRVSTIPRGLSQKDSKLISSK